MDSKDSTKLLLQAVQISYHFAYTTVLPEVQLQTKSWVSFVALNKNIKTFRRAPSTALPRQTSVLIFTLLNIEIG